MHFSVSHPEEIWKHPFQLGVLGGAANMTLYLFWLKCVLFICKLENCKKDSLLIISGGHFLGAHMVDSYHFGSGCGNLFECLLKQSLSHQTWEIDRYKQQQ